MLKITSILTIYCEQRPNFLNINNKVSQDRNECIKQSFGSQNKQIGILNMLICQRQLCTVKTRRFTS